MQQPLGVQAVHLGEVTEILFAGAVEYDVAVAVILKVPVDAGAESRIEVSVGVGQQRGFAGDLGCYYYTSQNIFSSYNNPAIGLFCPEGDCLITRNGKFTAESFSRHYMRIRDEGTLESLVAFFTQSDHMRLGFCPLYGETGKDMLFVSVPVRLGLTKDDVLLFFQLDEGAIHSAYFSPPGAQAAQYAVLRRDTSEMLYTIGGDYVKSASLGVPSNGAPVQRRTDGGVEYRVITSDSKALGYRYVGILPSDALMQKVDAF